MCKHKYAWEMKVGLAQPVMVVCFCADCNEVVSDLLAFKSSLVNGGSMLAGWLENGNGVCNWGGIRCSAEGECIVQEM